MNTVTLMRKQGLSTHKSIRYAGISNNMPYAPKKPRIIQIDREISKMVQQVVRADPHMEHEEWLPPCPVLWEACKPQKVKKICHYLGWSVPAKPKKEIIRSSTQNLQDLISSGKLT